MLENTIPQKIHYCWFGGKEKPPDVLSYIETWRKYLPEYEIIEWNEKNFSIKDSNPYVKEAYENKKWAFVSDYVRLYALYNYGGIYLDTDVQLFQSFNSLLYSEAFFGFESKDYLSTSVMGAISKHWFIKEFLCHYKTRHFIDENGNLDMSTTNVVVLTKLLRKYGLILNGKHQNVKGIDIYPQLYFSDNSFLNIFDKYRKGTFSYHHYSASWYEAITKSGIKKKIRHYLLGKARNILGTETLYKVRHKK